MLARFYLCLLLKCCVCIMCVGLCTVTKRSYYNNKWNKAENKIKINICKFLVRVRVVYEGFGSLRLKHSLTYML